MSAMVDVDVMMDWIAGACCTIIATCDKIMAGASIVKENAQKIMTFAESSHSRRNVQTPIPDDWEQVPAPSVPGGGAHQQPPAADHQGSDDTSSCAICMEPYEAAGDGPSVLPACGHTFHAGCLAAWLRRNRTCPLCRATVEEPAPPAAARIAGNAIAV